mmetsp:Transcript_17314/g.46975  ORF Transcript_17314/g.46975 Transcript_17314/m.46975 type:complete len:275 (-) Transcript_17314:135-959(-)
MECRDDGFHWGEAQAHRRHQPSSRNWGFISRPHEHTDVLGTESRTPFHVILKGFGELGAHAVRRQVLKQRSNPSLGGSLVQRNCEIDLKLSCIGPTPRRFSFLYVDGVVEGKTLSFEQHILWFTLGSTGVRAGTFTPDTRLLEDAVLTARVLPPIHAGETRFLLGQAGAARFFKHQTRPVTNELRVREQVRVSNSHVGPKLLRQGFMKSCEEAKCFFIPRGDHIHRWRDVHFHDDDQIRSSGNSVTEEQPTKTHHDQEENDDESYPQNSHAILR